MSQYDEEAFQGRRMDVFMGEKEHAEEFCEQWKLFMVTNDIKAKFTTYKGALLFLTYINGPKVNTWVQGQYQWLKKQLQGGIHENDRRLVAHLEKEFKTAFGDSLEKIHVQEMLRNGIVMKGYEIDKYVAQFEGLVQKAGYDYKEPQVIDLFTNGIEGTLYESCEELDHPRSYGEWIASLEKRVSICKKLEACRPELSRSSPPSNTPSLSSLEGERSEDDDEELLAQKRKLEWLEEPDIEDPEEGSWPGKASEYMEDKKTPPDEVREQYAEEDYQESFDFEVEEELDLAQENMQKNRKTPDEAVEYVQLPLSHKIKREKRQKKKVRINEWTEEFKVPPAKAREEYVPEDLTPVRTPSRWEQQVQHARQELMMAQMQGPSTWAQYRFHPDAMDQGARVRT